MLFTITYTGENAPDLGFLLHKNPDRPQRVDLNFGRVYVFYPEVSPEKCTAALLLDIDPLDLVRGKRDSQGGSLFDYVNDRPYVSSSFMSTAISRVYGTAMAGNCAERQALADSPLDLTASLTMLPCRGDTAMLERVFAPLGYEVHFTAEPLLDEQFPEWGESRYVNLTIKGKVLLRDMLRHIYVLIPVFDRQKHYWVGEDEIDKLIKHGEGWLENHPERGFITSRYFKSLRRFSRIALDRLDNGESGAAEEALEVGDEVSDNVNSSLVEGIPEILPKKKDLNTCRLEAVVNALKTESKTAMPADGIGVNFSVIDLGCGEGNLLRLLLKDKTFTRIAGTDVSVAALEKAEQRLEKLPDSIRERFSLFQSSLTYRDKRFRGYDAAVVVEVMEHIDENRVGTLAGILFGYAQPKIIIITTPNIEYNKNYAGLTERRFRHKDHRFEWTREQFHKWADEAAGQYGYSVRYEDIGDSDEDYGSPTQMGVFNLCR
jgi:3' terminal RNA ribose 2'-O-methyltransferase Hen1